MPDYYSLLELIPHRAELLAATPPSNLARTLAEIEMLRGWVWAVYRHRPLILPSDSVLGDKRIAAIPWLQRLEAFVWACNQINVEQFWWYKFLKLKGTTADVHKRITYVTKFRTAQLVGSVG